jgi:hypothetical protein
MVALGNWRSTTTAKRTQEANSSQAAETEMKELAALPDQYSNVNTLDGRRAIVQARA